MRAYLQLEFGDLQVKRGSMAAINGVTVIYGLHSSPPPNYTKIDKDLNKGATGEYVYLCYTTTLSSPPITGLQVFAGDSESFGIQNGYKIIPKDLNKGAEGKFIYVCTTTDKRLAPITGLDVIQGDSRYTYPNDSNWVRIDQDCSEGAKGDYTYIVYKH